MTMHDPVSHDLRGRVESLHFPSGRCAVCHPSAIEESRRSAYVVTGLASLVPRDDTESSVAA